jgi:hypothetical protein
LHEASDADASADREGELALLGDAEHRDAFEAVQSLEYGGELDRRLVAAPARVARAVQQVGFRARFCAMTSRSEVP